MRDIEPDGAAKLLTKARERAFDLIELVGLAIALALTVVLSRYSVADLTPAARIRRKTN